jgi:ribulose 1,5-bisphosphate synthetase/thiazole synthase
MKRRDFFTKAIVAGSALSLGIQCKRKIEAVENIIQPVTKSPEGSKTVKEPERDIPIFAETDVLVVGAGPSGVTAAIAASRTGASTWLIERYNHVGGLWTGGIVLPL